MPGHDIDTGTSQLLARLSDGILTLTLNRPEARNAMTLEMMEAMARQLAQAETDPGIRCVVLTGAGKAFCAGGDVKAMIDPAHPDHPGDRPDDHMLRQRLAQRGTAGKLFDMPKPTLAVINGPAAGAGLSLAFACDVRIMSSASVLSTAFSRVGLPGDFGIAYFMTLLIGTARSRELMFLSDAISSDRAVELGLANWQCAPDLLAERASAIAARLAAGPSVAYRYMKENLNRALIGDARECMDLEATHHVRCMSTADHREAAAAFVEKREPVFAGV
ncbi:enoyl-CoA hydratase [Sphingomonas sp. Root710]|uniref:enoyl-CoA hydratase n=1 Tax=Sphingomonas sp. Root710 TaxID=1736594 RepID=UPI0006FE03EA|nr:enoyl-CoA hydratase [Sphingomonas sp. Root710]KRB85244.1 enoyl-CoA hydratase [Sphingomonas sp. Root710]